MLHAASTVSFQKRVQELDVDLNSRLRWTYRPGSDLFLVFNQGWTMKLAISGSPIARSLSKPPRPFVFDLRAVSQWHQGFPLILFVAHLLQPLDRFPVEVFLISDVLYRHGRRRAMPCAKETID
jgi:hypothetical protein